ncbi:hypothetical protein UlMin_011640 [Ulmus minor]
MAYYSYNQSDYGEYHQTQTPYYYSNDSYNISQSSKDPSIYNLFDYDPSPFHHAYTYNQTPTWSTTTAYSNLTPTQSKSIVYDPNCYYVNFNNIPQTQFVVSYSVSEYDIPEFDEYDPTPYDGGYDISQTYGKPLPPSDQTCYPISGTASETNVVPLEKIEESPEEKIPQPAKGKEEGDGKPQESGGDYMPNYDQGSNWGRQMSQIPSGYGLEAMDLCESLFGYWPCLARYAKRENACGNAVDEGSCGNPWNGTADYLFGSSYPYSGERRDEVGGYYYGQPVYGYERHYQEQPLYGQVQVQQEEDSWSQNFRIF